MSDRYYGIIYLLSPTGRILDGFTSGWYSSIAIDSTGNIYLANITLHRIQKHNGRGSLITQWGSEGDGDGQFKYPYAIVVDKNGNVYVDDIGNNRIQKFDSNGVFLSKWGSTSEADGQFRDPEGVAVDANGNVYVADTNNNRIQKFAANGDFISKIGGWAYNPGNLHNPTGVALDRAGNVYVVDQHRIQIFDSEGQFIRGWGEIGSAEGEFSFPQGVAVAEQQGVVEVYVADTENHRIQKFDAMGQHLKSWGTEGSGPGEFKNPSGVAVFADSVYVTDSDNNRIQKFTPQGTFSAAWGSRGPLPAQFQWPSEVAVDPAGYVYVADSGNNRIQKFDSNGNVITTWSGGSPLNYPWGVAAENFVFVTDTNNHQIQKFTLGGIFLTQWGSAGSKNGQFQYPKGVTMAPVGRVYVADGNNNRIQVFEPVPPTCQLSCPEAVYHNDPGLCGAAITYPKATLSGDCSGVTVSYDPPEGFFQVGSFTVTCTAIRDMTVMDSCSFAVTVFDNQPPIITCPSDITRLNDAGLNGAIVNYPNPTVSDNCPGVTFVCNPPSGSFFLIGTTVVTCTATDASGNTSSCSFNVTIVRQIVFGQPLITNYIKLC